MFKVGDIVWIVIHKVGVFKAEVIDLAISGEFKNPIAGALYKVKIIEAPQIPEMVGKIYPYRIHDDLYSNYEDALQEYNKIFPIDQFRAEIIDKKSLAKFLIDLLEKKMQYDPFLLNAILVAKEKYREFYGED